MIGLIGLNHKTAPIEVREQCSFTEEEVVQFIEKLERIDGLDETVVLATCNRTEVYFHLGRKEGDRDFESIIDSLIEFKNITADIRHHFYLYRDTHAVLHLFKVASGLNSMVLGENQILGQVKDAYRISSTRGLTGPVLNRLFHKSFEAGKRVRAETSLNEGASSISYAAVELAVKIFGDIRDCPVLLIGAGETGELVLKSMVDRGSESVYITNRTFERAVEVATKYRAETCRFEMLDDCLTNCAIVVVSTNSQTPIISHEQILRIVKRRNGSPLFFIDISVPRNVEESIKELDSVFVYDIDDLEEVVSHNYEKRREEIEKANRIIADIKDDFIAWFTALNLSPTIDMLKDKFDSLYTKELEQLQKKVSEDEYQRVEEFTRFLKGKWLGLVIKNLKKLSNNGKKIEYIDVVNSLFELKEQNEKN